MSGQYGAASAMDRAGRDEAARGAEKRERETIRPMLALIWRSPWILLISANLLWASNIVVGRAILGPVPAISLSFWRWTGAFAVAFWLAWPHLKRDWPILLAHWKLMLLLAATGIAFFNTAAYIGLAGTTSLNVLILQSCLPLIVIFWAFAFFRERPSRWQIVGAVLSLCGVAAVAAHGSMDALSALQFRHADLWILAAATVYGIYIVCLRGRPSVHPLSFMQVMMGLGALMVAPFYVREIAQGAHMTSAWSNYAGIAYMAVGPSFVSYLFFNRSVQLIGGARAGQSTHLMPLFGSVMAILFLGETLRPYHLTGALLVGAGLALAHFTAPAPAAPAVVRRENALEVSLATPE